MSKKWKASIDRIKLELSEGSKSICTPRRITRSLAKVVNEEKPPRGNDIKISAKNKNEMDTDGSVKSPALPTGKKSRIPKISNAIERNDQQNVRKVNAREASNQNSNAKSHMSTIDLTESSMVPSNTAVMALAMILEEDEIAIPLNEITSMELKEFSSAKKLKIVEAAENLVQENCKTESSELQAARNAASDAVKGSPFRFGLTENEGRGFNFNFQISKIPTLMKLERKKENKENKSRKLFNSNISCGPRESISFNFHLQ